MNIQEINWIKHLLKIGNDISQLEDPNPIDLREQIEPWLTAVFQSEHLALLTGSGLTTAICKIAGLSNQGMERIRFKSFTKEIYSTANSSALSMDRGEANFEDDLRTAIDLLKGLDILKVEEANLLRSEINQELTYFLKNILAAEKELIHFDKYNSAITYLKSFLISFASRTATRDRLQIFTTNYDRFIEYACDQASLFLLDHFVGKIEPIFRASKLELDYHYNPPGIRGEPRYVEGVAKLTKLHGSIDWRWRNGKVIRVPLPFGADEKHPEVIDDPSEQLVIYPNPAKGIETAYYPYSELFRDFASAICHPNSSLVTYGYGFGDSHINRIIKDMLTIPSTHLVVISYDDASGRIAKFINSINHSQITLLIGSHFGDLETLVDYYLPKAAIDRLTQIMQINKERRGLNKGSGSGPVMGDIYD